MDGSIVYSTTGVTSLDGEISINHHTHAIYFINKDYNGWVTIKLDGGPHQIVLPDANAHMHIYVKVPGDYVKFEVMTAGATVAAYAVG